MVNNR